MYSCFPSITVMLEQRGWTRLHKVAGRNIKVSSLFRINGRNRQTWQDQGNTMSGLKKHNSGIRLDINRHWTNEGMRRRWSEAESGKTRWSGMELIGWKNTRNRAGLLEEMQGWYVCRESRLVGEQAEQGWAYKTDARQVWREHQAGEERRRTRGKQSRRHHNNPVLTLGHTRDMSPTFQGEACVWSIQQPWPALKKH